MWTPVSKLPRATVSELEVLPRTVSLLQRWLFDVLVLTNGRLCYYPKYKPELEQLASRTFKQR